MTLAPRFWNTAESGIAAKEQFASVLSFLLKIGAVTGNQHPVADLVPEQLDGAKRGKFAAENGVSGIGDFRKDQP